MHHHSQEEPAKHITDSTWNQHIIALRKTQIIYARGVFSFSVIVCFALTYAFCDSYQKI